MRRISAKYISRMIEEAMWTKSVKPKWHPKDGFFTKSAEEIARGLKSNSKSLGQAMSRINFFVNRAGGNLSSERKSELEKAKEMLSKSYPKVKSS